MHRIRTRLVVVMVAMLAMLSAGVLQGCSDPKAKVAGTYELDKAAVKASAEAKAKAEGPNSDAAAAAGMMAGMIDAMNMSVTLNVDGTASMAMSMMGQSETASGTWTLDGSAISITANKTGEAPETISGTVSGDSITLKSPEGQQMPFDMVFKKKKA